jgi:hypothetical protein
MRFWSADDLTSLIEDTRARLLHQHPMMTKARVKKTAIALSGQPFQQLIREALREVGDEMAMAAYLRTLVLHSLSVRIKELIAHVGQGDERRLLAHVKLPVQFGNGSEDVITICESGSYGDGTTRSVVERWPEVIAMWSEGFIGACPNAEEDAIVRRFWSIKAEHERWRSMDSRSPLTLKEIAGALMLDNPNRPIPATILRILFEIESVEAESFPLYEIAYALEEVRRDTEQTAGRAVLDWELATAAVNAAVDGRSQILQRLYLAYGAVDASADGSLSPEARLAEQAFRLATPLCIDGCRGCVQQGSDLTNDSLTASSVSRRLLQGFIASAEPR